MLQATVQLSLRHGDNQMTTHVLDDPRLKVGRKVRLEGDNTRLWLIEAIYHSGMRMDPNPPEMTCIVW